MRILITDSDLRDLSELIVILARLLPDAEIFASLDADDALSLARTHNLTTAFFDASINITGKFHELSPNTNIITTPKPLTVEGVNRSLPQDNRRLYVQTFGGFSVFRPDGKAVEFRRTKAKELLALLVDRRGCTVSAREACAVLFEDSPYSESQGSCFRVLVSDLIRTLKAEGAESIIRRNRNLLAVNTSAFDCDAYQFLKGEPEAMRRYRGDYLMCYSWAEYSAGMFQ
ncbi:MAG: hypothetical protein IJT02_03805 [Synergistaceae bacterium]|nr:hypothetical protein [Synergistaceae bacterium]